METHSRALAAETAARETADSRLTQDLADAHRITEDPFCMIRRPRIFIQLFHTRIMIHYYVEARRRHRVFLHTIMMEND